MRILVVTDAWRPQVNGVVRSLEATSHAIRDLGSEISFLTPEGFRSLPLPTDRDIRIALATPDMVAKRLDAGQHDHVHIATEGPLGLAARRLCLRRDEPFTTSYHTKFPEYLRARIGLPERISYAALRRFHAPAAGVMVSTQSLRSDLESRGFPRLMLWSRGVDLERFQPRPAQPLDLPRPVFLYVGRVAVEKNLPAFLSLDLPGTKVVVGDGPAREALVRDYPDVVFTGLKTGDALAALYAGADAFVFPSRTDTFGLVMLEALASGLPVAAFPVAGPRDVIGASGAGVLDEDLRAAALAALAIPREKARAHAQTFSWNESARQFLGNIKQARDTWTPRRAALTSGKYRQPLGKRQFIET
jgi:glycosyltransferase involved in cell wall biosynthesis